MYPRNYYSVLRVPRTLTPPPSARLQSSRPPLPSRRGLRLIPVEVPRHWFGLGPRTLTPFVDFLLPSSLPCQPERHDRANHLALPHRRETRWRRNGCGV